MFGNNQHFFPVYIQNFSGYIRLKVLVVTRKKCWLFPGTFFPHLKSSVLNVSNLAKGSHGSNGTTNCTLKKAKSEPMQYGPIVLYRIILHVKDYQSDKRNVKL